MPCNVRKLLRGAEQCVNAGEYHDVCPCYGVKLSVDLKPICSCCDRPYEETMALGFSCGKGGCPQGGDL